MKCQILEEFSPIIHTYTLVLDTILFCWTAVQLEVFSYLNIPYISLVLRPFHHPVFDRLQFYTYIITGNEASSRHC